MNLVKLSKYFGLYNLYVSMFQCFTETNGWPGISAGFLCNIWTRDLENSVKVTKI